MAKEGRVFLRGMSSEQYGLKEFREAQLAAPRVRSDEIVVDDAKVGHSGDSKDSRTWWRLSKVPVTGSSPCQPPPLTRNAAAQVMRNEIGKPPASKNFSEDWTYLCWTDDDVYGSA